MAKFLRITGPAPGYRAGGILHNAVPTTHPASAFTDAQLDSMKKDALLKVVEFDADDAPVFAEAPKAASKSKS